MSRLMHINAQEPGHRRPLHLQQPRLPSLSSKFAEYIPAAQPRIPAYRSLGILEQLGLNSTHLELEELVPSPSDEYSTQSRASTLDSVAPSSSIRALSEEFGRPSPYSPAQESPYYGKNSYRSIHEAPNQYLPEPSERSWQPRGQSHAPSPLPNISHLINPPFEYPEVNVEYHQNPYQTDAGRDEFNPPATSNDCWAGQMAAANESIATMHPYYQPAALQQDQKYPHTFLPQERCRNEPPRQERPPSFASPIPAREPPAVPPSSSYYFKRVLGPDLHGYYPETPLFQDPSYVPTSGTSQANGRDERNSEREQQLVYGAWPVPISGPVEDSSGIALVDDSARFQFAARVSSARRHHHDVDTRGEADPPLTTDDEPSPFPSFKFETAPNSIEAIEPIDPTSLDLSQPAAPSRSGYGLRTHSATVAAFSSYQPPRVSHTPVPPSPTTIKAASSIASLASESHSYATSSTREEPPVRHATRVHASLPPLKTNFAAPNAGPKKRKASEPSSDESEGQQSPSRGPADALSGDTLQTTKPDANLLVAWDGAEGKFVPDDKAGADLERILLTADEFVRVWAPPAGRGRGRGGEPMIEVFPWSDDGGLTWIQGQHRNKPACPCGSDYYSTKPAGAKPKLKSGEVLREHVVRCSRVGGDTGLKKLCRKLEQGKSKPSKPAPMKKRRGSRA